MARRQVVKNFSTRFSLTPFAKRVQLLTAEQRLAISRTGFGNLLSIPNHTLNKVFLTEVMEAWNSDRQVFEVGSGEIAISLLDVALILGIPVVGHRVELKEEELFSDFEGQYGALPGKRKVAMATLEARLDTIGDVVSDDFVRSFLLFTIGTFLSSNDGKVDSRYLSFLGNLDGVSSFAWGAAVVEDLCQWLDKRKENSVQYVGGCLILLQTWSYEHFDMARPHLQNHDRAFPRVCRWDHSKSHPRQRSTSRFKDLHEDQIIWKLQPTSEELQINIIKEAMENYSASTLTKVSGVEVDSQLSISCGIHREDEVNFENLVVEDTPTRLSTCDEGKEEQFQAEKLMVEDYFTNLSMSEKGGREDVLKTKELIVVETPPKLRSDDDDLRKKNIMLEEENTELKMKISQLMEEFEVLHRQNIENIQVKKQNDELKQELNILREENRSLSSFAAQIELHIKDYQTSTNE
ncbi:uncharacterized protein [Cicer arietinum]|uniref:Protein MAIN-LIKE 1-like isoform X2 n=1 Tax=Cicer arietinum TaxID=3827 RepID=A0A3Q7Y6U6_CICAR|nr:protein MAIN-LIKE 1-like isoform X2 [Cicer arietinum]XP_027186437.1 protein MAIN-LIKE 1-like isoform X2 [Cicer arietinum]XP_027186438.1 protein MAIN-LIKE 1-like isoform X2 [Cicer arietinum]